MVARARFVQLAQQNMVAFVQDHGMKKFWDKLQKWG
jgi:hypothetical protein